MKPNFLYYVWFENEAASTIVMGTSRFGYVKTTIVFWGRAIYRFMPWNFKPTRICEIRHTIRKKR